MKKLSHKQKLWRLKRKKKRERRSSKGFQGIGSTSKTFPCSRKITVPVFMNLEKSYDETVQFFNELRKISENRLCDFNIDFKPLKDISSSAALIFTSEMDRICRIRGRYKLRALDYDMWDQSVRAKLFDMGMYNLLKVKDIPNNLLEERDSSDEIFLRFQSGDQVDPDDAIKLRGIIKTIAGLVPNTKKLQQGLTEAMDNSLYHAYPDDYQENNELKKKLWWMSAAFNEAQGTLTVIFFDQGIGIPESLPRNFKEYIGSFFTLLADDATKLEAAMEIGRSRTKKSHRGNGLGDIKEYISSLNDGYLKIISGCGKLIYQKVSALGNQKVYPLKEKLQGTLIEWRVKI